MEDDDYVQKTAKMSVGKEDDVAEEDRQETKAMTKVHRLSDEDDIEDIEIVPKRAIHGIKIQN